MIRVRISPTAFRVKVMASISSGLSTVASRVRKRCIRSSVFPEPAGAWTINDLVGAMASALTSLSWMILLIFLITPVPAERLPFKYSA